jgi:hypothetical protein
MHFNYEILREVPYLLLSPSNLIIAVIQLQEVAGEKGMYMNIRALG